MKTSVVGRSLLTPSYGPAFVVGQAEQCCDGPQRLSNEQMGMWSFGGNFSGALM